jgi:hypothetical protein
MENFLINKIKTKKGFVNTEYTPLEQLNLQFEISILKFIKKRRNFWKKEKISKFN